VKSVTASARADDTRATVARRRPRLAPTVRRAGALAVALFLVVGALQVMKTGAAALGILQAGSALVENTFTTLGLGWLGALLVLSGSPIAATSLALVAAGEESGGARGLSELEGFAMLTGSRVGAAFVVLVVAVVYAARAGHGQRRAPVSTAVLALAATAAVYLPAALLGLLVLSWEPYSTLDLGFPAGVFDLIDLVYGDIVEWSEDFPAPLVFVAGIGVLLIAFKLIDSALPDIDDDRVSRRPAWLRRKWPMFGLGAAVALVTMSVSVALAILVPLVAKKMVRQEYVLPYILGANITTLGDTMLAAFALDSAAAVRVVLVQLVAAGALSLLLLALAYPAMWSALWSVQTAVTRTRARLAAFTLGVLLVPVLLIALGALIG
jgi:sodium-dependent phosphate cotransporter